MRCRCAFAAAKLCMRAPFDLHTRGRPWPTWQVCTGKLASGPLQHSLRVLRPARQRPALACFAGLYSDAGSTGTARGGSAACATNGSTTQTSSSCPTPAQRWAQILSQPLHLAAPHLQRVRPTGPPSELPCAAAAAATGADEPAAAAACALEPAASAAAAGESAVAAAAVVEVSSACSHTNSPGPFGGW